MHDSIWWMYYYMQLIRTNLTTETELKAWSKRRKRLSHNRTCRDYVLKKKKGKLGSGSRNCKLRVSEKERFEIFKKNKWRKRREFEGEKRGDHTTNFSIN